MVGINIIFPGLGAFAATWHGTSKFYDIFDVGCTQNEPWGEGEGRMHRWYSLVIKQVSVQRQVHMQFVILRDSDKGHWTVAYMN